MMRFICSPSRDSTRGALACSRGLTACVFLRGAFASSRLTRLGRLRNFRRLRIDLGSESVIRRIDVGPADDRLTVLRENTRNLVAHDRPGIGMRRPDERALVEGREYLLPHHLLAPALR